MVACVRDPNMTTTLLYRLTHPHCHIVCGMGNESYRFQHSSKAVKG
jgi:hypothetical protein